MKPKNCYEAIHEELAREGGSFLKIIALTTALLAAFAAMTDRRTGMTPSLLLSGRGGSPRPTPEPEVSGHLDAAL